MALASKRAGFAPQAEQSGENLLCKKAITDELLNLANKRRKSFSSLARTGYYRLAFGSVADAVSLLYREKPTSEELKEMDLFLVSEIKRPKDGSMEIKFFDRLKALEHLEQETEEDTTAKSFFDAIGESAKNGSDENGN